MENDSTLSPLLWHYDGVTARRRTPQLLADASGFRLIDPQGDEGPFAWRDLVARDQMNGARIFGLKGRAGWRLALAEQALPPEWKASLPRPERYGRWIDRFGLFPSALVLALVAGLLVKAILAAPHRLVAYVPMRWEQGLGNGIADNIDPDFLCTGTQGQAALDALMARLVPTGPRPHVQVLRVPDINAVTLPGGRILLFGGLLFDARSPDEIAGVLGHEVGHVQNRDAMEAMIRQIGLNMLFNGLHQSGDALGLLLSTNYSRQAETRADDASIAMLRHAAISPAATAAFFERLSQTENRLDPNAGALWGYISSHPLSHDREQHFLDSIDKNAIYRPALTPEQWQALRRICSLY